MFARYMKMADREFILAKVIVASLALFVIAGCSTSATRVKTWEGEGVSDAAVLKAPSTIKVKEVNGRKLGNFLLEDLALDYELLPGTNTVVFTHKTIWAKSGVVRDGESSVHVVETEPQQVVFDASAGETYRFDTPKIRSRTEARKFAENVSVPLVTDSGAQAATSEPYRGQSAQPQQETAARRLEAESLVDAAPAQSSDQAAAAPDSRLETLDALKMLWERASGEEKREFLRWAFD